MKTVTDFKRYLRDGGTIQLVSVGGDQPSERINKPRRVKIMQTNNCMFEGGSWLDFPSAKDFKILDNNLVDCDELVYKLINI